ncbi:MAG: cell division control protein Cdc6 [Candidatus Dadabacteria bacterium]
MSSDDIDNIFERAATGRSLIKNRNTLSIDYVPDKLPFRDQETKGIAQILSTSLRGSRPSNLFIFGDPGTGKTVAVKNVIDRLQKKANELKQKITVPFVNGKLATTSYKVLFQIAEDIGLNQEEAQQVPFTGLSIGEATDRILQFIKKKKLRIILIIDEIDSLVEREKGGDDLLYNFTRANERLKDGFISLVGISNNLLFKEMLSPRVRSSLSEEEMLFNPYKVDQLKQILLDRVALAFNEGAVTESAINLCAAIAGREHGDARKAIDLLRVAAELAERENATKLDEKHIRQAQEKIEKDAPYNAIKNAVQQKKFVILAIAKSKTGHTGEVYEIYSELCRDAHQEPPTQRRMTQIISELKQLGLVSTDILNQGRYGNTRKITLTIPFTTIRDALKDDPVFSELIAASD